VGVVPRTVMVGFVNALAKLGPGCPSQRPMD
jgi:hypothetical protein